MVQKWPVKKPLKNYRHKPRPFRILETGIRAIDTLNPIAEGGTGFIPGPFGCGKTVLQHAISKQADADIVILAACGERANEVVEIFKEFPGTGGCPYRVKAVQNVQPLWPIHQTCRLQPVKHQFIRP